MFETLGAVSGGFFGLKGCSIYGDFARPLLFGNLACQLDGQQAIDQRPADDFDMIGEVETALKGAPGDAVVQVSHLVTSLGNFAGNDEVVFADCHVEVGLTETGDGDGDFVSVLSHLIDVIRWVGAA